ncbi:hypothetical protein AB1Y20_016198 [Prymnesium parvum]|uniref:PH domain-containing protein n=1 Tax=Prymnesium parvum TaxID=97485 RepID=A0AB34IFF3_PRYPA
MEVGWLDKLAGGASDGSRWSRRFFSLRGAVLLYHTHSTEPPAPSSAPRGAVCLSRDVSVVSRAETAAADGSLRFEWAITHPNGDTLVLAAHTESERERWVSALRAAVRREDAPPLASPLPLASPPPPPPPRAAGGAAAAAAAAAEAAAAEAAAEAVEAEVAAAAEAAAAAAAAAAARRAELCEAAAALRLRQALVHWRERTLLHCFRQLVGAQQLAARGLSGEARGAAVACG